MNITIERAKLVKQETLEVTFSKVEKDKSSTAVTEKHKSKAHPDLVNAYNALAIHLGLLTGYISPKSVKDITKPDEVELVDQFKVTSFSLGGDEGAEGFVLTGHRLLPNGKAVILNSPFTRFEEKEETRYQFMEDLDDKLGVVQTEVAKYLGGKVAPDPQQDLFEQGADQEKVTKMTIAPPADEDPDKGPAKPLFKDNGKAASDDGNNEDKITNAMVEREMMQKGNELASQAKKKNAKGKK